MPRSAFLSLFNKISNIIQNSPTDKNIKKPCDWITIRWLQVNGTPISNQHVITGPKPTSPNFTPTRPNISRHRIAHFSPFLEIMWLNKSQKVSKPPIFPFSRFFKKFAWAIFPLHIRNRVKRSSEKIKKPPKEPPNLIS